MNRPAGLPLAGSSRYLGEKTEKYGKAEKVNHKEDALQFFTAQWGHFICLLISRRVAVIEIMKVRFAL